jgi:hypothetical protein
MFFYMNVRRQAPVIMPNVVKPVQPQPQKLPQKLPHRQVVTVPLERIVPPVLTHESNESREICDNKKEEIIIYNIGDENVEECIPVPVPVPVLEEPVIETLSKPVEIIVEEKVEEIVKTKVEDNKKKNKKKNARK